MSLNRYAKQRDDQKSLQMTRNGVGMSNKETRTKIIIGDNPKDSRVLVDGEVLPGVARVELWVSPDSISKAIIHVYTHDCIIEHKRADWCR